MNRLDRRLDPFYQKQRRALLYGVISFLAGTSIVATELYFYANPNDTPSFLENVDLSAMGLLSVVVASVLFLRGLYLSKRIQHTEQRCIDFYIKGEMQKFEEWAANILKRQTPPNK